MEQFFYNMRLLALGCQPCFRIGYEERAAKLLNTVLSDHFLGGYRNEPINEMVGQFGLDMVPLLGINGHYTVGVEKGAS